MLQRTTLLPVLLVGVLGLSACDDGATATDDEAEAVLPGKADNYLSPTSREYKVWGLGQIALDAAAWADADATEREAHVRGLVGYHVKAYAHFVNEYLTDKEHSDANKDYGGFAGLIRGTTSDYKVEAVDDAGLSWAYTWEVEMGAPRDLLAKVPLVTGDDGHQYVIVKLPVLTESQLQFATYPASFDPATYTGEMEQDEPHEYHLLFNSSGRAVVVRCMRNRPRRKRRGHRRA